MNKIHKKEISKLTQKLLSSKTTETEGKKYIYDKCRKKKVIATPEEYVRQTVYSIEQNAQTGTTLTMELGNGYQAVYGQLTDLTVSEGDTIKKGTTIGYIAQPTKYYSTEGTNLYFAMKKDGEPIDPIEYLP